MHNIDTLGHFAVHMCGFDGAQRANYFGGVPIGRAEVEMEKPHVRMR